MTVFTDPCDDKDILDSLFSDSDDSLKDKFLDGAFVD